MRLQTKDSLKLPFDRHSTVLLPDILNPILHDWLAVEPNVV